MPAMSFHIRNEGDLPMQSFPRLRREDTRGDGGDFSRRGATNVADVPSVAAAAPARLVRRARWNDADECDDDAEERDVGSRCERALSCARGK